MVWSLNMYVLLQWQCNLISRFDPASNIVTSLVVKIGREVKLYGKNIATNYMYRLYVTYSVRTLQLQAVHHLFYHLSNIQNKWVYSLCKKLYIWCFWEICLLLFCLWKVLCCPNYNIWYHRQCCIVHTL